MYEEYEPKPRDARGMNAYRHGLTGQIRIQSPEEMEAYGHHCTEIHTDLAPVGAMEKQLAQEIAEDQWRLARAKAIEESIFALGIERSTQTGDTNSDISTAVTMAQTWLQDEKKIALLNLYAHRIQSALHKNINQLRKMQKDRHAAVEKAAEQSNLLAQLAESKGESYAGAVDLPRQALPMEFIFSIGEIDRTATLLRRLAEAKTLLRSPQPHRKAA